MKLKTEGECEACSNVGPLFQIHGSSMKLCETHHNAELEASKEKKMENDKPVVSTVQNARAVDTIFSSEEIRSLQVDERTEISKMSIEEISNRIQEDQRKSREIYIRMMECSTELHKRLSTKTSDELESLVRKVPAAETHLSNRRVGSKVHKPTFAEKVQANMKKGGSITPEVQAFLDSLKAK